jgi:FtsP/CotA-like multicopper oxidase with cupredoxin domain
MIGGKPPLDRRAFLGLMGGASLLAARPEALTAARSAEPGSSASPAGAQELTLTARAATLPHGAGEAEFWTVQGQVPGPTLRFRRGDTARITLLNELPESTILHWHGLDVPEAADGHPRLAIAPGERYEYAFEVADRPGTYWYHPHTHERTAPQTYRGMAGFLIIEDDEEEALGLPTGAYDLPLLLQDKRIGPDGGPEYQPAMGPDLMLGYLGDTPYVNGAPGGAVEVRRARYRLRLLNGSNARIFDLGLVGGGPFTLIGADGGLRSRTDSVDRLMLATGERADVLVDFSRFAPGERITLRSHAFTVPGMMGMMGGGPGMGMGRGGMGRGMGGGMRGLPQGAEMDLVDFVVGSGPAEEAPPLPDRLSGIAAPSVDPDAPRRTFRFESMMMQHAINGRSFDMERVDARVPLGRQEVWELVNDSGLPHPVHVHAGQFRVVSRSGGRGRIMPWESGPKDTVLVLPGERVEIAVRFTRHPGLFLMHCHNLEHEDAGMMMNFLVEE